MHLQLNVGGPASSDLEETQKFLREICLEERRQAARKAALFWMFASQELDIDRNVARAIGQLIYNTREKTLWSL